MEPEKTLLQQIREKEQEYVKKTEEVRAETEAAIKAAENEGESLLCTTDSIGRKDAEKLYWEEKAKVETEIESLKREAVTARDNAVKKTEENLPRAVEAIVNAVTGG